jgi:hypothetical protein
MITSDKRNLSLPEGFPEGDYKNKSDACMNLQASLFAYESFCPYRATNLRHDYPGRCPGLGTSALSGRKGTGWVVTFIL